MIYQQYSLDADNASHDERRRHQRFLPPEIATSIVQRPGFLSLFSSRIDSSAVDVSEGGLRACLTTPIDVNRRVAVDFTLKRLQDHLMVQGIVQWIEPHPSMKGVFVVGVRFDRVTPSQARIIAGWRTYYSAPLVRQRDSIRREKTA